MVSLACIENGRNAITSFYAVVAKIMKHTDVIENKGYDVSQKVSGIKFHVDKYCYEDHFAEERKLVLMSVNTTAKLNLLLLVYTVAVFLYLPLAVAIQAGVLVYLFKRRELKYASYGTLLFICAIIINIVVYRDSHSSYHQVFMGALIVIVFANLFWFAATIKQLKRMFHHE